MNPRLFAITGPLEGQIFEIEQEEFSIGRLASNDLQLREVSVSRRHCDILRVEDRWALEDRGSRHGTFVNGLPIDRHRLEHGDYFKVCGSLFLVLLREDSGETPEHRLLLDEAEYAAESTVQMSATDNLGLRSRGLLAFPQLEARYERHLETLLEISTAIQSIRGVEPLARRLMELIAKVVPAQRTAVLLTGKGDGEFERIYSADGSGPGDRPFRLSRTTAARAMREKLAVLCNDVLNEQAFDRAESLHSARIQSLICAPLLVPNQSLGVLYADTSNPAARFNQAHLKLMTAVAAIAAAAFDNAVHLEWLQGENQRLRAAEIEHNMVGDSRPMRVVYRFISRVAPTTTTVLIRGESGTGKELAARAIHHNSPRLEKPFVAINCAVLSETLLESELFGHERGAFTGAVNRKLGRFEVADGGTLFLDEVGEIPLSLQAKLLRALEEQAFQRLGGNREIHVDIRVIAATNRDLEAAIDEHTFREDLFYRLNVISLSLPPLRERREDIALLARHFAALYGRKLDRQITGVSVEALKFLTAYDWPGNVRELANSMERAIVMGQAELIRPEDLPESVLEYNSAAGAEATSYHEAVHQTKRRVILDALQRSGGSYVKAAKRLGLHRNYLHRLVRNLNLKGEIEKA